MKCYLCNTTVQYVIDGYYSYNACLNCKHFYIKKEEYNNFIETYIFMNYNFDIKYLNNVLDFADITKIKNYSSSDIVCKNISCRKNCNLFKYKYYNLNFLYCNLTDYFIINKNDFNKFIKRIILYSKIKYYYNKIKYSIISIFVEGVSNVKE